MSSKISVRVLNDLYMAISKGDVTAIEAAPEKLEGIRKQFLEQESDLYRSIFDGYFRLISLHIPDLPNYVARRVAIQYEDELRHDPSQPEIWIAAARAHRREGNDARARQLLRRVCASEFAVRQEAQVKLADWVGQRFASTPDVAPSSTGLAS